jgi:integrase
VDGVRHSQPSPPDQAPDRDQGTGIDQTISDAVNKTYGGVAAEELDAVTLERLASDVPENTRNAYRIAWDAFAWWCQERAITPLPASEITLTRYVSHMRTLERAPATISQHIGAIRSRHDEAGYDGQPNTARAARLLRGYRRHLAKEGIGQRQSIPITPQALRKMVATLDASTVRGRRDQLALVLGFTGMLRRSELVGLRTADVTITDDGVTLLVRTSKTDKDSVGRSVPIPPQSSPEVDPVNLTQRWMDIVSDGYLLRAVARDDALLATPWRAAGVRDMVRRAARDAGLPSWERYTAHSLRAGGLTASLRAGTPLGVAARHGGWNPESPVPSRYARVADQWKDNAMRGVL